MLDIKRIRNNPEEIVEALKKRRGEYPMPLILDGIIDYDTLKQIGKNKEWITNMLIEDNVELENVFYAFYRKNKLYIIKDNDLRK